MTSRISALSRCVCVCVCVCEYIHIYPRVSHPGCYGYQVSIVKIQHFCFHGHTFTVAAVFDVTTGVSVISMLTIELGLCVTLQGNLFGCHGSEIS